MTAHDHNHPIHRVAIMSIIDRGVILYMFFRIGAWTMPSSDGWIHGIVTIIAVPLGAYGWTKLSDRFP